MKPEFSKNKALKIFAFDVKTRTAYCLTAMPNALANIEIYNYLIRQYPEMNIFWAEPKYGLNRHKMAHYYYRSGIRGMGEAYTRIVKPLLEGSQLHDDLMRKIAGRILLKKLPLTGDNCHDVGILAEADMINPGREPAARRLLRQKRNNQHHRNHHYRNRHFNHNHENCHYSHHKHDCRANQHCDRCLYGIAYLTDTGMRIAARCTNMSEAAHTLRRLEKRHPHAHYVIMSLPDTK